MKKRNLILMSISFISLLLIALTFWFVAKEKNIENNYESNESNYAMNTEPDKEVNITQANVSDLKPEKINLESNIPEYHDIIEETTKSIGDQAATILQENERHKALQKETLTQYARLKGKPGAIWGTVKLDEKAQKVPLRILLTCGEINSTIVVDENMHYAFEVPKPGLYNVEVLETEICPAMRWEKIEVFENQSIPSLDFFEEDGTIEVIVKDDKETILPGAEITVGKSHGGQESKYITYRRGVSDDDGRFVATNLTDGKYVVIAKYATETESKVYTLEPDKYLVTEISIFLSGRQIRGIVKNSNNEGLDNYKVELHPLKGNNNFNKYTFTDDIGKFVFNHIPEGEYIITTPKTSAYLTAAEKISITANDVKPNDFELVLSQTVLAGSMSGKVLDIQGYSINNIMIFAVDQDNKTVSQSIISSIDNSFKLNDCPAGIYSIMIYYFNPQSKESKVIGHVDNIRLNEMENISNLILNQQET